MNVQNYISYYCLSLFLLSFLCGCKTTNYLSYHLANPAPSITGDPNCGFYWNGRYHLFYIDMNAEEEVSYAHVSSTDMVYWKWHPTTLTPATMGHNMFSGTGFITKEGRPAIIYHGEGSGRNQISFAEDDMLEKWTAPIPVEPRNERGELPEMRHWDPDCWIMDDTYYAISGGKDPELMKSVNLQNWLHLGKLLADSIPDIGVPRAEDISCPNMFRIGNKWMLLNLSHWLGCRYYLGTFENGKYVPEFHDKMNWMCELNGDADVFAPESLLTPDGRRVMWAWTRVRERLQGIDLPGAIQTLPRELSLPDDGILRIKPLSELKKLRYNEKRAVNITLKDNSTHVLKNFKGDALEMEFRVKVGSAKKFGVSVYCDENGENGFPITFEPENNVFQMDTTTVPLPLTDEAYINLSVFIDKNVIEVFVNDIRAALSPHMYHPVNLYAAIFCESGDLLVEEAVCWKLKSIYRGGATKLYGNR